MKIDPYNSKERYIYWRESVKEIIQGINNENSKVILTFYLNNL